MILVVLILSTIFFILGKFKDLIPVIKSYAYSAYGTIRRGLRVNRTTDIWTGIMVDSSGTVFLPDRNGGFGNGGSGNGGDEGNGGNNP